MEKCPYCNSEIEINHDDGYGYTEDEIHTQECNSCGKEFIYRTSIILYYELEKCPCKNGEDHKYDLTHTAPKEFSRMRCDYCGEERELTDQEREKFNIGTKESYFEKLNKQ